MDVLHVFSVNNNKIYIKYKITQFYIQLNNNTEMKLNYLQNKQNVSEEKDFYFSRFSIENTI